MPYGGPVWPIVPYHHSYPQPPGYAPAPAAVEYWGRYSDPLPMSGDLSQPRQPPSHMGAPPPPSPVHEMYGGPPDYLPPMVRFGAVAGGEVPFSRTTQPFNTHIRSNTTQGYPMDGGLPPPYGSSYPMAMAMAGPSYPPKPAGPGCGGRGTGGGGRWRRRGGSSNGHGNGHGPPRKGAGDGAAQGPAVYGREEVKGVGSSQVK